MDNYAERMGRDIDTGYDKLRDAIVVQACKDYRKNLMKLRNSDRIYEIEIAKLAIKELEDFFRSEWYECLTSIDGVWLMDAIKKDVFEC